MRRRSVGCLASFRRQNDNSKLKKLPSPEFDGKAALTGLGLPSPSSVNSVDSLSYFSLSKDDYSSTGSLTPAQQQPLNAPTRSNTKDSTSSVNYSPKTVSKSPTMSKHHHTPQKIAHQLSTHLPHRHSQVASNSTPNTQNNHVAYNGRVNSLANSTSTAHSSVDPLVPVPQISRPREMSISPKSSFVLDTDLQRMDGILASPSLQSKLQEVADSGDLNVIAPWDTGSPRSLVSEKSKSGWTAPDSWAVKGHDDGIVDNLSDWVEPSNRMISINVSAYICYPITNADVFLQHCLRILRSDHTFATILCPSETTTAELRSILTKKFFLNTSSKYEVLFLKNGMSRVLLPLEKPVAIQERLLQEIGYQPEDKFEEVGREDHSYYFAFSFRPTTSTAGDEDVPLKSYVHVNLEGQKLRTIPISLYRHANEIQSLSLSRNLAVDVPNDFVDICPSLHELKYAFNEAARIPPSFGNASKVIRLDLSNNQLEDLGTVDLSNLKSLEHLRLQNNQINSLPEFFTCFKNLQSLDLSWNQFTDFPDVIFQLEQLEELDFSFNQIPKIPAGISSLRSLQRLIATNNRINELPSSMRELTNLRELDLRFNQLQDVSLLDGLVNLEQLYCGNNYITSFPTIASNLQYLHMIKNPLSKLNSISTSFLAITYLNLSSARLASLPATLFDSTSNLERLILDNNEFTSIPELGKLKNLQHLSCCNNQLNSLPPELGQLRNVSVIDVHDNNLKGLPDEIWYLCNLTTLNASSNLITTFPKMPPSGSSISSTSSTIANEGDRTAGRQDSVWFLNRPNNVISPLDQARRESIASNFTMSSARNVSTMSQSIRVLSLGDNRLTQDCFEEIQVLTELRVLNLSYNDLSEVPPLALSRLIKLSELYLSGNELTTLPSDDLDRLSTLRV